MVQLRFMCGCVGLLVSMGCVTDDASPEDVAQEDAVSGEVPLDRAVPAEAGKVLVTLPDGNRTAESGSSVRVRVALTSRPIGPVEIFLVSMDYSEGAPVGFCNFNPRNWNQPQDIRVEGLPDDWADGDQPYEIRFYVFAPTDPAYRGVKVPSITLVNQDDDTAGILLTPRGAPVTRENGGEVIVDVSLRSRPIDTVNVSLAVSDPTEAVVGPATLVIAPQKWNQPHPVTLRGIGDLLADGTVAYDLVATAGSTDPTYAKLPPARLPLENRDAAAFSSLGDLPGGPTNSSATDVNGDGTVVVGYGTSGSGTEAALWSPESGMVSLASAPSRATRVDRFGNVIVGEALDTQARTRAALWKNGTGPQILPFPYEDGFSSSTATAVSGDGQIVGGLLWQMGGGGVWSYMWHGNTHGPSPVGMPTGINASGSIWVGNGTYPKLNNNRFPIHSSGRLPYASLCITSVFCDAQALDVSVSGRFVVGYSYVPYTPTGPDGRVRAVLWDTQPLSVTTLSSQATAQALSLSSDGRVVVGYQVYESSTAMRWMDGTERKVSDLLVEAGIDMTGWRLTTANAASYDGRVIVGDGIDPAGHNVGWIAVLP